MEANFTKLDSLHDLMDKKVSLIAGCQVHCWLAAEDGIFLAMSIPGSEAEAVSRLESYFGKKFAGSMYDEETDSFLAGAFLER